MTIYFVVISFIKNITYRIFLSLKAPVVFVILLSTYNIKILVLVVSFLNEFKCIVLKVITYVSKDMSVTLVIDFSLFLVSRTSSVFTSTLVSPSLTFYCLESSFSSVSLSPKYFSDSFSYKKDSFKILDSSLLESFSSSTVVFSR